MAKSRTRGKPYNPAKSKAIEMERREKVLRQACANLAIVFVSGSVMAELYDLRHGKFIESTLDIDYALRHHAFHWSVFQCVFCVGADGIPYPRPKLSVPGAELQTRDDIAGGLVDTLKAMVDACNPKHVRGHGWIACAGGQQLTMDEAAAIFEPLNPYRIRTAEEVEADNNDLDVEIANVERDLLFRERYA